MCRSKAEGGKRCFTHAMDDDYVDLKKRRAKAKAKGNVEEAKALLLEMLGQVLMSGEASRLG